MVEENSWKKKVNLKNTKEAVEEYEKEYRRERKRAIEED